jgi:hypothetical protein
LVGFYSFNYESFGHMSWSVDTIYQFMRTLIRKNQSGGLSATEFAIFWNAEQQAMHDDIVGKWQKAISARAGLIENEIITTKLAPFTISATLPVVSGEATKPADHIYTLAIRVGGKNIVVVNPNQVWAVNDDVIDPPSITNGMYYATAYEDYYTILPSSVASIDIDYIASCVDVNWAYTLDPDGRQVYNAGASAQPQWKQPTIIEITRRTLKSLGVSFKDRDFEQYGQSVINNGD